MGSYWTQTTMSTDYYLTNRVAAAAAQEGQGAQADQWASSNRRTWAAAPGWAEAWDSYLAANPEPPKDTEEWAAWVPPGKHDGVITDGMILSQVQSMLGG